jgi:hypothetical protein
MRRLMFLVRWLSCARQPLSEMADLKLDLEANYFHPTYIIIAMVHSSLAVRRKCAQRQFAAFDVCIYRCTCMQALLRPHCEALKDRVWRTPRCIIASPQGMYFIGRLCWNRLIVVIQGVCPHRCSCILSTSPATRSRYYRLPQG